MGCASEHSSLHHQSLVQVLGAVRRPDHDDGTTEKASANKDRRMSKIATSTTTAGRKTVNKSCDTCNVKKRRCDGGRPCSRCLRRGDGHQCTYSTRRTYTSMKRRARLWSSAKSSGQTAVEVASAASGSPCLKLSVDTHCRRSRKQRNTSSVIEASPPLGFMATPKRERPPPLGFMATPKIQRLSPSIDEVYTELARAQQGMMSLIVSTNSLPQRTSNTGPYQQTSIKQHCVPCVGDSSKLEGAGKAGVGYVEMVPRTVSLEVQSNPRSSNVPGLEIDCPVVASSTSSALESDSSTTDDEGSDSSTLDLDMNSPSCWSDDGGTIFAYVPIIDFDQHLPPTSENITDITTAATFLDQTLSALGQEEQDTISAEDWFEFAAKL